MSKLTQETFHVIHKQIPEQWQAIALKMLERDPKVTLADYNGCVHLSNGVSYLTNKAKGEIVCS